MAIFKGVFMYYNTHLVSSFAIFSFFKPTSGSDWNFIPEKLQIFLIEMKMPAINDENYVPTHSYNADI